VTEDLLLHGADEDAEDALIHVEPEGVVRVGLGDGVVAGSLGDRGQGHLVGAVEEAVPSLASDVGDDLHLPKKEISVI
jgi:hypothetical protein